MRRGRAVLLGLHRYVGLSLSAFLLLAGPTGSVAAFHDAIDGWLNPDLFRASSAGAALSPAALEASLARQIPNGRLGYLVYRPAPGDTVRAYLQPKPGAAPLAADEVFLNPATGAVQGARDSDGCCLGRRVVIPFLYRFHYSLGLGQTGILLMGIVSLVWALDCVVGLLLTLPVRFRPWGREGWRRWSLAWRIEPNRTGIRRVFDLHRALSLWLWIMLLGVAISGVSLNLGQQVFRPVVSALLPVSTPGAANTPGSTGAPRSGGPIGLDQADRLATTAAAARGWSGSPDALYAFGGGKVSFYFTAQDGHRTAGLGGPIVSVDTGRGAVTRVEIPGRGKAGDVVLDLQFPWHSGAIAGLPGRILIAASGIVVPILVVTGLLIWNRKRSSRRRSRHATTRQRETLSSS